MQLAVYCPGEKGGGAAATVTAVGSRVPGEADVHVAFTVHNPHPIPTGYRPSVSSTDCSIHPVQSTHHSLLTIVRPFKCLFLTVFPSLVFGYRVRGGWLCECGSMQAYV